MQINFIIDQLVKTNNILDEVWVDRPVPFMSLSFRNCIDTATNYTHGGTKYDCGNGLIYDGVADFINSISTVKELVFEKHTISMEQLLKALAVDFEGFESIQKKCLEDEKYGNDLSGPDSVAAEMLSYIAINTNERDSKYGKLMTGILPVTAHVPPVWLRPSVRVVQAFLPEESAPTFCSRGTGRL